MVWVFPNLETWKSHSSKNNLMGVVGIVRFAARTWLNSSNLSPKCCCCNWCTLVMLYRICWANFFGIRFLVSYSISRSKMLSTRFLLIGGGIWKWQFALSWVQTFSQLLLWTTSAHKMCHIELFSKRKLEISIIWFLHMINRSIHLETKQVRKARLVGDLF